MTEKSARNLAEAERENRSVNNPAIAEQVEFLNMVIAICLKDVNLLEKGEQPAPKTVLVSEHYDDGSQTRSMSNSTINHVFSILESLLSNLPASKQAMFCMKHIQYLAEESNND